MSFFFFTLESLINSRYTSIVKFSLTILNILWIRLFDLKCSSKVSCIWKRTGLWSHYTVIFVSDLSIDGAVPVLLYELGPGWRGALEMWSGRIYFCLWLLLSSSVSWILCWIIFPLPWCFCLRASWLWTKPSGNSFYPSDRKVVKADSLCKNFAPLKIHFSCLL